jgi:hypothetical protein
VSGVRPDLGRPVRHTDTHIRKPLIRLAAHLARNLLRSPRVLATIKSCALVGIDAALVDVECSIERGLPQYTVVGLPATSVREGATRIQSALRAIGYDLPLKHVTVNLAPADLRKPGCGLDLPIALAVLIAEGIIAPEPLADLMILGELGLDGTIRAVHGVLAAAMLGRAAGLRGMVVPVSCAAEANVVDDLTIHPVRDLGALVTALRAGEPFAIPSLPNTADSQLNPFDMADVRGQHLARAAVEIAVAGGHNLLLVGPPGTGDLGSIGRPPARCGPAAPLRVAITTRGVMARLGASSTGLSRSEMARRWPSRTRIRRSWRSTRRSARNLRFSGDPAAPSPSFLNARITSSVEKRRSRLRGRCCSTALTSSSITTRRSSSSLMRRQIKLVSTSSHSSRRVIHLRCFA